MMRNQRKFSPLVALFLFEIGAIVFLSAIGGSSAMRIPFDDLSGWLATGSLEQLAFPLIRLTALAIAYWLLATTTLSVLAQYSRVPAAIRATSMFTLPSVRRVVDGALVVSIASASIAGTGSMASAAEYQGDSGYERGVPGLNMQFAAADLEFDSNSSPTTAPDDMTVTTPRPQPLVPSGAEERGEVVPTPSVPGTTGTTPEVVDGEQIVIDVPEDSAEVDVDVDVIDAAPASSIAPEDLPTTSEEPEADVEIVEPDGGWVGSVATPRPTDAPPAPATEAAPVDEAAPAAEAPDVTEAPVAVAEEPETTDTPEVEEVEAAVEADEPDAAAPVEAAATAEVLGEQTHRVVPGDNLWTISRDAVAQATGRSASEVNENEIRTYWLKVIDVNRDNLRSQDPHWIFPGEVIYLPPMS